MQKQNLKTLLLNPKFILGVYIVVTFAASIGQYLKGHEGEQYTRYNNFIIFRESFHHLINNIDLYKNHEPEHYDYYKYSPTFSVAMAPFIMLPDLPGLILWNLCNSLLLFFAIRSLPVGNNNSKIYMLWFILQELLTTMQNSQSNGLVVALLVWAFNMFEKRNVLLASLFILLSAYIKIFGILAALLFLFYPDKIKFVLYSVLWFVVLTCIPLLLISTSQLIFLYKSWFNIVAYDQATEYGMSLIGVLHSWFNADPDKNILSLTGLILLCLPLFRYKFFKEFNFRIAFFSSILIWLIVFNHRAESSTFVIAITGIAIWFFNSAKKPLDIALLIFAFVLTSLSPTDLFPHYLREHFVQPYVLKALPCILIWIKLTFDLIIKKKQ